MDDEITIEELWNRYVQINVRLHEAESLIRDMQIMFICHKHGSDPFNLVRDRGKEHRVRKGDLSLSDGPVEENEEAAK